MFQAVSVLIIIFHLGCTLYVARGKGTFCTPVIMITKIGWTISRVQKATYIGKDKSKNGGLSMPAGNIMALSFW